MKTSDELHYIAGLCELAANGIGSGVDWEQVSKDLRGFAADFETPRATIKLTASEYVTLMVGLCALRVAIDGGVRIPPPPAGVPAALCTPDELSALEARVSLVVAEALTQ